MINNIVETAYKEQIIKFIKRVGWNRDVEKSKQMRIDYFYKDESPFISISYDRISFISESGWKYFELSLDEFCLVTLMGYMILEYLVEPCDVADFHD